MTEKEAKREISRETYYEAAGSWARDREGELRSSRGIAWIVAGLAVVVAVFEAAALVMLTPLKTVEPYTLMVDRNTGYVQALKPLDAQMIAPDTALTQSFMVQYVIARESFDVDALQANYRKVVLWSAEAARADYIAGVQVSNPGSPLARLPRSTTVETRVKSVSPLGGNAALVRFETQRRDAGGQPLPLRSWVAVIRYRFTTDPLQQSDRYLNPLGFQVVRYRRDQEQIAPPEPAPATAPPSALDRSFGQPAAPGAGGLPPAPVPGSPPQQRPPRRLPDNEVAL